MKPSTKSGVIAEKINIFDQIWPDRSTNANIDGLISNKTQTFMGVYESAHSFGGVLGRPVELNEPYRLVRFAS